MSARKQSFSKVGLFDENLRSCEDWDLWIRRAQHYDVDLTPEILLRYYSKVDSMIRDHAAGVGAHRDNF